MCVLFIAKNISKQYPLIIIANRDEFYNRPTAPIKHWPNSPIVAGQDLQAGGTWLGITATGKIAALTNIRDPKTFNVTAKSRGDLVSNHLMTNDSLASHLIATAADYNGYNLLFGDQDTLQVFNSASKEFVTVNAGIHGLSNAALNTPWPKVLLGKQLLAEYLRGNDETELHQLAALLNDTQQAPAHTLPNTGIPLDIERALSPLFIHHQAQNYGTRCTSVLRFSATGAIDFLEITYDEHGREHSQQTITL